MLNRTLIQIFAAAALVGASALPAAPVLIPGNVAQGTLSADDPVGPTGANQDEYMFMGTAGQTATISMNSNDFDSFLRLVTPSGSELSDDDSGGNFHARLTADLTETGRYLVQATAYNANSAGNYSLQLGVAPTQAAAPAAPPDAFHARRSRGGSGGSRQRRRRGPSVRSGRQWHLLQSGDTTGPAGQFIDSYTFQGQAGQAVTIRMDSAAIDPLLNLLDSNGNQIASDDDGGGFPNAMISQTLPQAGTYTVQATSFSSGSSGPYTVTLSEGITESSAGMFDMTSPNAWIPSQGPGTPTGSGQSIGLADMKTDSLAAGDSQLDSGEYCDFYSFRGSEGDQVRIELTSDQFDTYIILRAPDGSQFENDDAGSTSRSLVDTTLPQSGMFDIIVTSFGVGETGSYTLRTLPPPVNTPVSQFSPGQTVQGVLGQGDTTNEGKFQDDWPLLVQAGQRLTIEVNSEDFDTYLDYTGPSGASESNDDFNGLNSRVDVSPQYAGTATVTVTTFMPNEGGSYTLTARENAPDWGQQPATPSFDFNSMGGMAGGSRDVSGVTPTSTITSGQPVNGTLSVGDQQLSGGQWADVYSFEGQPGQQVSISLFSNDFDTYLVLVSPDGTQSDNDDSGMSMNSQLDAALSAGGTHTVVVSSYGGSETGNYTLTFN